MLRKRLPTFVPATLYLFGQRSMGIAQKRLASPRFLTSALVRLQQLSASLEASMAGPLIWVATLAGFWLRAFRLDFQPLWFDEGYSLYFANNDFLTTASLTAADIHPPFYYNFLHVWMAFTGPSDVSVRFFSVFTSTLSIPLAYALAKRIFDQRLAVSTALLLSLSPLHVYYSQEVRMYSLVTFLALLSTWAFASVVGLGRRSPSSAGSRGRTTSLWIVYVVAESLSLHTQYYAAFVPAAHLAFLLWRRRNLPRLWENWIVAQIVVFITFLPWVVYAGLQLATYVGRKVSYESYTSLGFLDFFWRFFVAFSEGTERPETWQWAAIPVLLIAALGVLGWLWTGGREGDLPRSPSGTIPEGVLLCVLLVLVSGLAGWIVNQRLPFNPPRWERLYLFALPFFIMLLATGIRWLSNLRPTLGWLALSFCLAISIPPLYTFYAVQRYPDDDYRPLVRAVSAIGRPEDLVLAVYPWQIGFFQSYYRGPWPKFALMSGELWSDPTYRAARLNAFGRSYDRIWIPAYQGLGGLFERQVESFMASSFFPAINEWHGKTRLLLFHTGFEPSYTPRVVDFEGQVRLLNYGLDTSAVEAGRGFVDVALFWRAQKQLSGKLVAKLRLYDEAGHTWSQRDSEPQAGLVPADTWTVWDTVEDRHGLLVPAGTPPGEYNLGLSLTLDGKSLNIIESDGNPHGQELVLGKVKVYRPQFVPRLESLPIQTRMAKYMGDGIEMVGYSMGDAAVKPGETAAVNAFWRAKRTPRVDHQAVFKLVGGKGEVVSEQRKSVGQSYPSTQWTTGEAVRDQYDLAIPAATASGVYELRLSFDDNRSFVRLGSISVEAREHRFLPPSVPHSFTGHFGNSITLVGFDVGGQVLPPDYSGTLGKIRAGDSLTLKLVWRVDKEVGPNLKVFAHVVDSGSRIWGQRDSVPGQGTMPTSGWVQGEYLEDGYEITLKPDTPPGTAEIIVGFYDPLSGERLPVYDAAGQPIGDKVVLGQLEVGR